MARHLQRSQAQVGLWSQYGVDEVRDAVQGSQLCVKADLMAELVDNAISATAPSNSSCAPTFGCRIRSSAIFTPKFPPSCAAASFCKNFSHATAFHWSMPV